MTVLKKIQLVLFILFVLSSELYTYADNSSDPVSTTTPKKGIITGKVMDENGTPIEYANLIIYRKQDSSLVTGSISKFDGTFEIKDIPPGSYYLTANFIGYNKEFIDNISIFSDNLFYNAGIINLSVSKTEIESVEVVADRARVEYKIDKKVVNVSQDVTASGGSAVDVLANTPSITTDIEGNVELRGSSSFTVLIDGKPTVLQGSEALQQIPAATIENIEIITNPSAKYDPDGTAGIINVVLKKNAFKGLTGLINASIGTGDKYKTDFLLNYKTKKFNYFIGGNYQDETFHGEGETEREYYFNNKDSIVFYESESERQHKRNRLSFKTGFDFYLSPKTTISLAGDIGHAEFGRNEDGKVRLYNNLNTFDSLSTNNNKVERIRDYYEVNLNLNHKFNNVGHEINAMIIQEGGPSDDHEYQTYRQADNNYNPLPAFNPEKIHTLEDGDGDEYRIKIDYTRPLYNENKFEAGYQARIDDEFEGYTFEWFDPTIGTSGEWIENDLYNSGFTFKRQIHSVYSTYVSKLLGFDYQLGMRVEYTYRNIDFEQNGEVLNFNINRPDFFPSIHISKDLNKDQQLMASYSRRINRPRGWNLEPFLSYSDKYTMRKGNPDLQPEYIDSYEAGYQKRVGTSFIAAEAFYRITKNKITRYLTFDEANKSVMSFDNLHNDRALGTEIMANYELTKWFRFNASTSIYYYKLEGDVGEEEVANESFNWDGRLSNTFKITPNTRVQLNGFYRGPSATAQGMRKGFWRSDLAIRQDLFKRSLSLSLQVRDIFGSMKFEFENEYADAYFHGKFTREPTVIMLSLSYKINNYNKKQRNGEYGSDEGNGEGDFEGGDF